MSFDYKEKTSRSPYVEVIWKTEDRTDGTYMAPADACWDLIFIKEKGQMRVLFSGPTTQPTPVPYKAGNKNLGIRFRPGAFMTQASSLAMRNIVDILPMEDANHFVLFGHIFEVPTFESADDFVSQLEDLGFVGHDYIVRATLNDKTPHINKRSVQRHFKETTGLSPTTHQRILQAQRAVALLRDRHSPIEAAHEAGYADQAHMTRTLKEFTNHTPAEIIASTEPIIIEHRTGENTEHSQLT